MPRRSAGKSVRAKSRKRPRRRAPSRKRPSVPSPFEPRFWQCAGLIALLVVLTMLLRAGNSTSALNGPRKPLLPPITAEAEAREAKGTPARDRPADFALRGEPEMRVRLVDRAQSVELAAPLGLLLTVGGDAPPPGAETGTEVLPGARIGLIGAQGRPISIHLESGEFIVRERTASASPDVDTQAFGSVIGRFPLAGGLVLSPAQQSMHTSPTPANTTSEYTADPSAMIRVNGKAYPGRMRILARADQNNRVFDVIEYVMIEQYLPGVVSKEMFANWPRGAFLAQAVIARTYALHERARSMAAGETFDVRAGQSDQAYDGTTINAQALEAVRETRGTALVFDGRLLRAYYSSTCGGRTGAARDTWLTSRGFEFNLARPIQEHSRNCYCQEAPLYRWTVQRTRAELTQRFRAFGQAYRLPIRQLQAIESISIEDYNADGRPRKYSVVESGASGNTYLLTAEEFRLACNTSSGNLPAIDRKSRVYSGDAEVTIRADTVTITGRGFGHGVGLCQYCAREMARQGIDWRSIVLSFYPGAETEKLY